MQTKILSTILIFLLAAALLANPVFGLGTAIIIGWLAITSLAAAWLSTLFRLLFGRSDR